MTDSLPEVVQVVATGGGDRQLVFPALPHGVTRLVVDGVAAGDDLAAIVQRAAD